MVMDCIVNHQNQCVVRYLGLRHRHVVCTSYHDPGKKGRQQRPGEVLPRRVAAKTQAELSPGCHHCGLCTLSFPKELWAQAPRQGSREGKGSLHFRPGSPKEILWACPLGRVPGAWLSGTRREAARTGLVQSPIRKGTALLPRDRAWELEVSFEFSPGSAFCVTHVGALGGAGSGEGILKPLGTQWEKGRAVF